MRRRYPVPVDTGSRAVVGRSRRVVWRAARIIVVVAAVAACDSATPSVPPSPTVEPSAAALRPSVQLDPVWTARNGDWTFTGRVDPQDDPTDVILEIGPGPATARVFDRQVPVQAGVTAPSSLTVTTRDIPDIKEIC